MAQQQLTPAMVRLEHFLDSVLRKDLRATMQRRDDVYQRCAGCRQMRTLLDEMRFVAEGNAKEKGGNQRVVGGHHSSSSKQSSARSNAGRSMSDDQQPSAAAATATDESDVHFPSKLLVDVGNHFYMECEVPDAGGCVHVNIGCGVVVAMGHKEAQVFLVRQEELFRARAVALSKEALRLKYRIRLVMEAITRLGDLQTASEKL